MPANRTEPASVERVRYREQQRLTAADLRAEQQYLIVMRRRHDIGLHGWGIVEGLGLDISAGRLLVEPGVAVDGYGRELIVPDQVVVSGDVLNQLGDSLSVWLLYGLKEISNLPSNGWNDGVCQTHRIEEEVRIRLTRSADGVNPRRPREVPVSGLGFTPDRVPPDDPQQECPVFLGTLRRDGAEGDYSVDLADRPYVGLVGEVVVAPSDRVQMQVGSEIPGDLRRFSVSAAGDLEPKTERFSIASDSQLTLFGDVFAGGDIVIAGSPSGATPWSVAFGASAPPGSASPWFIYRTPVLAQSGPPEDQFRFEFGSPGDKGDPKNFGFSIGHAADDEFTRCLSITADCTVTVRGTLKIEGQLLEGPIQPDPQDPRFQAAVQSSWTGGIASAATQLDTALASSLRLIIQPPNRLTPDTPLTYSIELLNTGRGAISNIHVYATLAEGLSILQQGEIALTTRSINEGPQPVPVEHATGIRVSAGGEVDIAVTAVGIGPAGNPIQAVARGKVTSTPLSAPG